MLNVIVRVSSFALIIIIGIILSRSGKLGTGTDRLVSNIVFNLTLPCAIIRAFQSVELQPALLCLIPIGALVNIIPFFASYFLYKERPLEERVIQQANVSGLNIGCFALSFVQALFPPSAVVATCLFDAGNSLMGTGGTWALIKSLVLNSKDERITDRLRVFLKALFSSVPFDCYLVLICLSLIGIRLPAQTLTLIDPIANANSFLSMFMIGIMIRFSVGDKRTVELIRILGWRLMTALLLTLATIFAMPFGGVVQQTLIVLAWAPAASTGPLYTLWAGGDEGLAGMANALTVLIGIVVMTALVLTLGV